MAVSRTPSEHSLQSSRASSSTADGDRRKDYIKLQFVRGKRLLDADVYGEAAENFARAHKTCLEVYGALHTETALCLTLQGDSLLGSKAYPAAEQCYQTALTTYETVAPRSEEHLAAITNLAFCCYSSSCTASKHSQASCMLARKTAKLYNQYLSLAPRASQVDVRVNYGSLLVNQARYGEAKEQFAEAAAIATEGGQTPQAVAAIQKRLATAEKRGRHAVMVRAQGTIAAAFRRFKKRCIDARIRDHCLRFLQRVGRAAAARRILRKTAPKTFVHRGLSAPGARPAPSIASLTPPTSPVLSDKQHAEQAAETSVPAVATATHTEDGSSGNVRQPAPGAAAATSKPPQQPVLEVREVCTTQPVAVEKPPPPAPPVLRAEEATLVRPATAASAAPVLEAREASLVRAATPAPPPATLHAEEVSLASPALAPEPAPPPPVLEEREVATARPAEDDGGGGGDTRSLHSVQQAALATPAEPPPPPPPLPSLHAHEAVPLTQTAAAVPVVALAVHEACAAQPCRLALFERLLSVEAGEGAAREAVARAEHGERTVVTTTVPDDGGDEDRRAARRTAGRAGQRAAAARGGGGGDGNSPVVPPAAKRRTSEEPSGERSAPAPEADDGGGGSGFPYYSGESREYTEAVLSICLTDSDSDGDSIGRTGRLSLCLSVTSEYEETPRGSTVSGRTPARGGGRPGNHRSQSPCRVKAKAAPESGGGSFGARRLSVDGAASPASTISSVADVPPSPMHRTPSQGSFSKTPSGRLQRGRRLSVSLPTGGAAADPDEPTLGTAVPPSPMHRTPSKGSFARAPTAHTTSARVLKVQVGKGGNGDGDGGDEDDDDDDDEPNLMGIPPSPMNRTPSRGSFNRQAGQKLHTATVHASSHSEGDAERRPSAVTVTSGNGGDDADDDDEDGGVPPSPMNRTPSGRNQHRGFKVKAKPTSVPDEQAKVKRVNKKRPSVEVEEEDDDDDEPNLMGIPPSPMNRTPSRGSFNRQPGQKLHTATVHASSHPEGDAERRPSAVSVTSGNGGDDADDDDDNGVPPSPMNRTPSGRNQHRGFPKVKAKPTVQPATSNRLSVSVGDDSDDEPSPGLCDVPPSPMSRTPSRGSFNKPAHGRAGPPHKAAERTRNLSVSVDDEADADADSDDPVLGTAVPPSPMHRTPSKGSFNKPANVKASTVKASVPPGAPSGGRPKLGESESCNSLFVEGMTLGNSSGVDPIFGKQRLSVWVEPQEVGNVTPPSPTPQSATATPVDAALLHTTGPQEAHMPPSPSVVHMQRASLAKIETTAGGGNGDEGHEEEPVLERGESLRKRSAGRLSVLTGSDAAVPPPPAGAAGAASPAPPSVPPSPMHRAPSQGSFHRDAAPTAAAGGDFSPTAALARGGSLLSRRSGSQLLCVTASGSPTSGSRSGGGGGGGGGGGDDSETDEPNLGSRVPPSPMHRAPSNGSFRRPAGDDGGGTAAAPPQPPSSSSPPAPPSSSPPPPPPPPALLQDEARIREAIEAGEAEARKAACDRIHAAHKAAACARALARTCADAFAAADLHAEEEEARAALRDAAAAAARAVEAAATMAGMQEEVDAVRGKTLRDEESERRRVRAREGGERRGREDARVLATALRLHAAAAVDEAGALAAEEASERLLLRGAAEESVLRAACAAEEAAAWAAAASAELPALRPLLGAHEGQARAAVTREEEAEWGEARTGQRLFLEVLSAEEKGRRAQEGRAWRERHAALCEIVEVWGMKGLHLLKRGFNSFMAAARQAHELVREEEAGRLSVAAEEGEGFGDLQDEVYYSTAAEARRAEREVEADALERETVGALKRRLSQRQRKEEAERLQWASQRRDECTALRERGDSLCARLKDVQEEKQRFNVLPPLRHDGSMPVQEEGGNVIDPETAVEDAQRQQQPHTAAALVYLQRCREQGYVAHKAVCAALEAPQGMSDVVCVDLGRTAVPQRHLSMLPDALLNAGALKRLDLSNSDMQNALLVACCSALHATATIESLNLDGNLFLSSVAGKALLHLVADVTSLVDVSVSATSIPKALKARIADKVMYNRLVLQSR